MIKFSGKVYDALKSAAQIWIPSIGTLYFALSSIWGLPDATKVVGSLTALDTAIGAILAISSIAYSAAEVPTDGKLVIDTSNPVKDTFLLQLTTDPSVMAGQKSVTLTVVPKAVAPSP